MRTKILALAAGLFTLGVGSAQAANLEPVLITAISSRVFSISWTNVGESTPTVNLSTSSSFATFVSSQQGSSSGSGLIGGNGLTAITGYDNGGILNTVFLSSAIYTFNNLPALAPNTTYFFRVRISSTSDSFVSYNATNDTMTLAAQPYFNVSGSTAVNYATDGFSLQWSSAANPQSSSSYTITVSTNLSGLVGSDSAFNKTLTTVTANPQATFASLTPNTTYQIRLFATNNRGVATAVSISTVITLAAQPAAASTVFTSVSTGALTVAWTANGNPTAVTTFTAVLSNANPIKYPTENADAFPARIDVSTVALTTATSVQSYLSPNTIYHLFVAAINHSIGTGVPNAPAFKTSTFTFMGSTATLAQTPLTLPGLSTAALRDSGSMAVQWGSTNNPTLVTTYTVVASTSSAFTAVAEPFQVSLDTLPANAAGVSTATLSGLSPLTTYFIQVLAHHRTGYKTSNVVLGSTVTLPVPVTALTVSSQGTSSLGVKWTDAANPAVSQKYDVGLSTTLFATGAASTTITTSLTSATFAGLAQGANFQVRVRVISPFALGIDKSTETEINATTLSGQTAPVANVSSATFATSVSSMGVSSITVSWLDGGNLLLGTSYTVQISSVSDFLTINHSSNTKNLFATFGEGVNDDVLQRGIGGTNVGNGRPNRKFYFRVQANSGGVSSSFVSLGSTHTLARPPGALAAILNDAGPIFVSSAPDSNVTIVWGLNGGPANPTLTKSVVERSTSTANFTTVTSSEAYFGVNANNQFFHKPTDLLGCTTYNYRVRHIQEGGGATPTSPETVIFVTSNTVPTPVPSLTATSLSGSKVKLTWGEAGPEGITKYTVYTDSGLAATIFSTGTKVAAVFSTATRLANIATTSAREFTTEVLPATSTIRFMVTASHRCGEETSPSSATFAVAVATNVLSSVRAAVDAQAGDLSNASNHLTVTASLVSGVPSGVSSSSGVVFQYSPAVETNCNGRLLSPTTYYDIGRALTAPFLTIFNLSNACGKNSSNVDQPLSIGSYNLRAVAYDGSGSSDTAPSALAVKVVAPGTGVTTENLYTAAANVNYYGTVIPVVNGLVAREETISATNPEITLSGVAIDGVTAGSSRAVSVTFSTTAFSVPTQVTVFANWPESQLPPLPSSGAFVGVASRIQAERPLQLNQTAVIKTLITDANGDGIIDGTTLRADTVKMFTNTPTTEQLPGGSFGNGEWNQDASTSYNAVTKEITGITSHFSFQAIAGVIRANLDLVRVYPVPFKPNSANADEGRPFITGDRTTGIIFDELPENVTIKIYTVSGSLVTKFSRATAIPGNAAFHWDARNDAGRNVASGGYFAVISSPGSKSVVKRLAIIR